MINKEKIIKGLTLCTTINKVRPIETCKKCPYFIKGNEPDAECIDMLMLDALELLKAQEPRVMTLEELDIIYNAKKTHVWPFNQPPYLWMTINPDVRLTAGYWICWRDIRYCLENVSPFYVRENYGKVWMIWTKKPTDEQRRAVKWDD